MNIEAAKLRSEIAKVFTPEYAVVSESEEGIFEIRLLVPESTLRTFEGESVVLTKIRDLILRREFGEAEAESESD